MSSRLQTLCVAAILLQGLAGCDRSSDEQSKGGESDKTSDTRKPEPKPETVEKDGKKDGEKTTVEVASVHWSSSNPSLGPNETVRSSSVSASGFESQVAWDREMDKLLDETRVNDRGSLREFLQAKVDRDFGALGKITAADNLELDTGAGFASVEFKTERGDSLKISNLKRTRLTGHWDSFWESHLRDGIEEESGMPPQAPPG